MSFALHYAQHVARLVDNYTDALLATGNFEAVLIHSGSTRYHYADDQTPPFHAYGHFCHWLPVNRPEQVLLILPGQTPVFFQVIPRDFWYEQTVTLEDWVSTQWHVQPLESSHSIADALQGLSGVEIPSLSRIAFLGENTHFATAMGLPAECQNPSALLQWLDFQRAVKSEYEVACIRKANRLGVVGHTAARHAFEAGSSEYEIHMAYLQACGILDEETPYNNIVALDEKAAILHYQNKRRQSGEYSQVLLIDAGCKVNGYCSDITRTAIRPHTLPLFGDLVDAMEAMQYSLVQKVRPGIPYPDIHVACHMGLTNILRQSGICHGSVDELLAHKVSTLFMPHGVGHLLGIQVHDVGGRLKNARGETQLPPPEYPNLRTTRTTSVGQVFTIEPGLYFIPVLLEPERHGPRARFIDWELVDALTPLGGIRIEDNVLVTVSGVENLTRVSI